MIISAGSFLSYAMCSAHTWRWSQNKQGLCQDHELPQHPHTLNHLFQR